MKPRKVKPLRRRGLVLAPCRGCHYLHNVTACPKCGMARVLPAVAERKPPRHFEEAHGIALMDWIQLAKGAHPDLGKLYHVPNGGARNEREGARLKAQGVRKGQLDYNLDVGRGGYFGLRIELKATHAELGRKPKVSPEQQAIARELAGDNYLVVVCYGWEQARESLLAYVVRPRTRVSGPTDFSPIATGPFANAYDHR